MNSRKNNSNKSIAKTLVLLVFIVIGIVLAITVNVVIGLIFGFFPWVINALLEVGKDISYVEEDLDGKVKQELAPKIIKIALPESEYLPYENISEEEYKQAEYVDEYNKYTSDEKIIIKERVDENINYPIEFTSIQLIKNSKDIKDFAGMFGYMVLPKDIRSKLKVNKEGTYEKDCVFKADIDNNEFEKMFDVMALNKKITNKILTDEIIEKTINIYNRYGYNMDINIIRNKLYVRIESGSIIKETKDGRVIDRIVMEKRYNMIRELKDLMIEIAKTVEKLEI